ncbi:ABC-type antimicrobial peptide transport system, permease component [Mucilaginibacter pineti]|uniref:ABC-type antimicrobial peptide transport system, permease component n=1 Tax=Mucilaginibacter pineti TaxID=1391627 RepID=A0A1G7LZJ1_9SPHI|nr:ABC transporter permease [Mucilaginibacter pineti]SDF54925.1 ABC-type antimicrobial peptide transport system, permease component [Mucilaginibacter pineti]
MEEHIWDLVEKFISGEASLAEIKELHVLLALYPAVYVNVKGFLMEYQDADPKVTRTDIYTLLDEADAFRAENHLAAAYTQKVKTHAAYNSATFSLQNTNPNRLRGFMSEITMAGQFLKIAVRNLQRNMTISFINITGLAVGIASAIMILLWVQNQLSYDQFHKNKDQVYQLFNRAMVNGKLECWGNTPMPMGPAIKADYSQVQEMARINWVGAFVLKTASKQIETQGFITDPGFLKIFSFPLLKGSASTALNGIHSIVLTEKLATRLFGNTDPMGKVIKVDSTANFTVTGVMKDLPNNTQFHFEYLVPWNYMKEVGWENQKWDFYSVQTVVMLKPGTTESTANRIFKDVYKQHNGDKKNEVIVHPLSKWWLYSKFENGKFTGGQIQVVRLFSLIAAFIMLIACINYMNLGTARSTKRAKEVGIRKVAGAGKSWLIKQFLGESVLIAFAAGAIGLLLVQICLPWFNEIVESQLAIPFGNLYFWLMGIGFLLFTGILAGSYPAFYLSSFKPVSVLKGTFKAANALIAPRKVLVVLQFTFAITFIICTTIIYRQIKYGQNRDTGYNPDNLVYVYMKGNIAKNYALIKNELLSSGAINNITRTNSPIIDVWTDGDYEWAGKSPNKRSDFAGYLTDNNFTKTMGLPLIAGRDIDVASYPTDTAAVLLNEEAAKTMGFANPIGKIIKNWQGNFHVVGVVKNFVAGWPYMQTMPAVIQGANKQFGTITLKLNTNNSVTDNISKIGAVLKKYNPDYPFNYKFLDDSYKIKFREEQNTGVLAAVFSGLTIFISCLGLFALAACMAEGRVKEIGIRKVLGASVARITALLTKDFLVLVCISFVVASPIAWWLMNKWLQNYPYHVNISWWIFVITGIVSVIIAFSTVVYQGVKVAIINPVKSLRAE